MPQQSRFYCSNCKNPIYNTFIGPDGKRAAEGDKDAVRVPLVHYIVTGQPDDTGAPFDGKVARITSFTRETLQMPVQRVELCEICFAEVFGLKLLTAEADPMYSDEQAEVTAKGISEVQQNVEIPAVDKAHLIATRALHAIKVDRGAAKAPKLPKPEPPKPPPPKPGVAGIAFSPLKDADAVEAGSPSNN